MADRPILFSGPMVRALLAGTKTQTRRILKPQPELQGNGLYHVSNAHGGVLNVAEEDIGAQAVDYLRISVGDRLWVKETWRPFSIDMSPWDLEVVYAADGETRVIKDGDFGEKDWNFPKAAARGNVSSLFMTRWASRLTLTVTDVRVERLQDCSRDDAMAEGIVQTWGDFMGDPPDWAVASINRHGDGSGTHIYDNRTSVENYRELWNHINGAGSWEANPWVAAYTFTVEHGNIDQVTP